MPKREMSKREQLADMNSIAQHASPIGIGHTEWARIQSIAASSFVTTTPPSILLL